MPKIKSKKLSRRKRLMSRSKKSRRGGSKKSRRVSRRGGSKKSRRVSRLRGGCWLSDMMWGEPRTVVQTELDEWQRRQLIGQSKKQPEINNAFKKKYNENMHIALNPALLKQKVASLSLANRNSKQPEIDNAFKKQFNENMRIATNKGLLFQQFKPMRLAENEGNNATTQRMANKKRENQRDYNQMLKQQLPPVRTTNAKGSFNQFDPLAGNNPAYNQMLKQRLPLARTTVAKGSYNEFDPVRMN